MARTIGAPLQSDTCPVCGRRVVARDAPPGYLACCGRILWVVLRKVAS